MNKRIRDTCSDGYPGRLAGVRLEQEVRPENEPREQRREPDEREQQGEEPPEEAADHEAEEEVQEPHSDRKHEQPAEHGDALSGVEPYELVLLLHEEHHDAREYAEEVREGGRDVLVQSETRLLRLNCLVFNLYRCRDVVYCHGKYNTYRIPKYAVVTPG